MNSSKMQFRTGWFIESVISAFEQANDIKVQFISSGDAGTSLNKAILSKDNLIADVFYGVDNTFLSRALNEDIFESYEVTIVSGLILALALYHITGQIEWIIFPLIVRGIGVLSSIIGTYVVRGGPGKAGNAMVAIFRGFLSSAAISAVLFFIAGFLYLNNPEISKWGGWWRTPAAVAVGVLLAILIDRLTEYFTGTHNSPVKEIKKAADTGPATLILQGISVGFESSVWAIIIIALTIVASIFIFGTIPGLTAGQQVNFVLYGVAMTGIGMLTLTGNNVAMDSFGPISDNANGIGEMAELAEAGPTGEEEEASREDQEKEVRPRMAEGEAEG
jgi:K(+)-stimulated pyrophosphate-energized sodium pump